jgi:hypothetical protein
MQKYIQEEQHLHYKSVLLPRHTHNSKLAHSTLHIRSRGISNTLRVPFILHNTRKETPEWRNGPDGPATLCNACGLHYAKLKRKSAMAQSNISLASHEYLYEKCSLRMYSLGDDLSTLPLAFRWVGKGRESQYFSRPGLCDYGGGGRFVGD